MLPNYEDVSNATKLPAYEAYIFHAIELVAAIISYGSGILEKFLERCRLRRIRVLFRGRAYRWTCRTLDLAVSVDAIYTCSEISGHGSMI